MRKNNPLIYLAFLTVVTIGLVHPTSQPAMSNESAQSYRTIILNETVVFDGRTFEVVKVIENGEKKTIFKPLNGIASPLALKERPKISIELQKMLNESSNESVSVTVTLKEQPLYNTSRKTVEKYDPEIQGIKSQVRSIHAEARDRALAQRSTAQVAQNKMEKDLEKTINITANLTLSEKQKIFEENSNFERIKQQMIREIIEEVRKQIQPQQEKVKNKITELSGTMNYEGILYNAIFARVPISKIEEIANLPEVDLVEKTEISEPQMDTSTYSIKADTFWNNGYTGSSFEVGVADTGVDSAHPALSARYLTGKDFAPNDCDGNNPDDLHGHGTHVAGTVASTDSTYKGVAYGANIINLKIADCDVGYSAYNFDVQEGVDWAIYTTSDAAEIISHSFGGETDSDEDSQSRFFDAVVDSLSTVVVISAGNCGPGATLGSSQCPTKIGSETITSPGISYNALTIGAMDDWDTTSRTDDAIASYSSRGPVPSSSRIKPDIMAPGSSIKSAAYGWEGLFGLNPDFVEKSGTSMAAPHISGTAALLMSTGVSDPREIKALLINTAEDYGTTGGDYDYGWGYVDLDHAYFHTPDVRLGTVNTSTTYLFYKGYG